MASRQVQASVHRSPPPGLWQEFGCRQLGAEPPGQVLAWIWERSSTAGSERGWTLLLSGSSWRCLQLGRGLCGSLAWATVESRRDSLGARARAPNARLAWKGTGHHCPHTPALGPRGLEGPAGTTRYTRVTVGSDGTSGCLPWR